MSESKDRGIHLVLYVIAGAAMGGLLDTYAFNEPSPAAGMVLGAVIAVVYSAGVWFLSRRKDNA